MTSTAIRGTTRRAAIHDAVTRCIAARLPLDVAALAGIAVRDAEPSALDAPTPVIVPLTAHVIILLWALTDSDQTVTR